jgi:biuret amidohydrolase
MVHRTPMPNLMPPVPPFPLAGGEAALLVLDMQPCFVEREAGIGLLATGRGIMTELDEYYEQVGYALPNVVDLLLAFRSGRLPVLFARLAAPERPAEAGDGDGPSTGRGPRGAGDVRERMRAGQAAYIGWLPPAADPDARVLPLLAPRPEEPILTRRAFNPFVGTTLDDDLRARGIRYLVVAGVGASTAVYQAARDGADRGFGVLVVADACPGDTFAIHDFCMTQLVGGLIRVRPTSAVLEMLAGMRT